MSTHSVEQTYGPLYLAAVLSTAFYGVTCMQTFFYHVHYQDDPLNVKLFVATLWALNTVHEALSVAGAYKFILAGLLSPSLFTLTGNSELVLLYLFTALVAIPTQGFFVYRIYLFSQRNIVGPLVWAVLGLAQLVCTAVYVAQALSVPNGEPLAETNHEKFAPYQILATMYLSIGAGVDVMIAVCTTFFLVRKRITSNFASTVHILQRLTVFSVNTGIWTATFALLSIIFLHIFPSNLIYTVFTIPLCPIYCNALLANLNVRAYLGNEGMVHNFNTAFFSTRQGSRASSGFGDNRGTRLFTPPPTKIWQTVEVVQFRDTNRTMTETE